MNADAIEELRGYIKEIKDGFVRGDAKSVKVADNVVAEVSVASFEMGCIHFRVWVDEPQLSVEEGEYYRKLFVIDEQYERVHNQLGEMLNEENEHPVELSNVWEVEEPRKAEEYPWLHDSLTPGTTVAFEKHVQLRDDVSVQEAIITNREEKIQTKRPGSSNE